ncbi:MAG TPA: helix-turn-helix transcriptional regulator [Kutzneria sp.]|nr:helix-turn-helix transcriptional regulator [Kutzneria sp.]
MTRPVAKPENESARLLGAELRSARVARGLSLRTLAKCLGLNGHGNLVDYEYGRRIPPADLLVAWERALGVRDSHFRDLRGKALAERAGRQAAVLLAAPPAPEPESPAGKRPRWRALALAVTVLAAAGVGAWTLTGPQVRMGFETDATRWWVLYGAQVARIAYSTIAYEGRRAEQVTVTGASAAKGYSAVGIAHDLDGLHSGSTVTLHLWAPGPQEAGVAFFVHDSRGVNHWAVESQGPGTQSVDVPLPGDAGWATYTWTVPEVDAVSTIGMQVWAENDQPVIVGVDAVSW